MDAVIQYCEENYLEPSEVAALINQNMKDKICLEMQELNMLPKQATLDI